MSNKGNKSTYSVSQNFLTSRRVIRSLLRRTQITKADTVLEIGAGKGHITKALAEVSGKVISYEIDPVLYRRLATQLPPSVCLYQEDFLQCQLPKEPYQVFANIPFSRTTEIIRKLTTGKRMPKAMWLVMEKGAAKRFCGSPRESVSSLRIKPYFETKIVYYFAKEDFHPAPSVDTVLVEWIRKSEPDLPVEEQSEFEAFLRYSFSHGVYGAKALLTKRQISVALHRAGFPMIGPSGNMQYVQWLCLFRCWKRFGRRISGK